MNIELKKGQRISVILYHGSSVVEAETLYNWLKDKQMKGEPVPLSNTDLNIYIGDVNIEEYQDTVSTLTRYKVELKGGLI